ncbi:hypothetical protein P3X46_026332 [Hevea brasiliensis]|uniref:Small ribosomal subunit protein mS38 n=1 Tax=Hevea brasiliensis TaxID=3981 RepID=A0ABQ9KZ71_HEVBR|nr:uncharacterized protein LOC110656594 [Hevea brasiliensis]KAJ9152812.1 hypothetical protein P3X46_026332 [Hevea brasiliensis]
MALSTLQKFFKTSSPPARILAFVRNPYINLPNPSTPVTLSSQTQQLNSTPNEDHIVNAILSLGSSKEGSLTHFDCLPFSSIHTFGFCSHPILSTWLIHDLQNDEDSGMWADSVKKKRKKKMNKHKYKKLRKRLRRQT